MEKARNRRGVHIAGALVLAGLLCAAVLWTRQGRETASPPSASVADVIMHDREEDEDRYYAVYVDRKAKKMDPFASDDLTVYTADAGCFESYIEGNTVRNRPGNGILYDEAGERVENTPELSRILDRIAELEHNLYEVKLIQDGDRWFVFVKLNVNWSDPCDLYVYDGALRKLYRFDNVDFVGLRLPGNRGGAAG